jgi:hypothetical protein
MIAARVNGVPIRVRDIALKLGEAIPLTAADSSWADNLIQDRRFNGTLTKLVDEELSRQSYAALFRHDWSREITENEMRQYYESHLEDFRKPTEVRWEIATVAKDAVETPLEAEEVLGYFRARARGDSLPPPDSYAPEKISISTSSWTSGAATLRNPLGKSLFQLPPGYVSHVVEDETGWHVVRVTGKRAGNVRSFDELEGIIRERMVAQRRDRAENAFLQAFRQNSVVWMITEPAKRSPLVLARGPQADPRLE